MQVLLVEPDYRKRKPKETKLDASAWYPPIGLLKLARFHNDRGDTVEFRMGCDKSLLDADILFFREKPWDRVYITTLFTFNFKKIIETIKFYKKVVGGTAGKVFVGGIMASIMPDDIFEETSVYPITGIISSSEKALELKNNKGKDIDIDLLPPDYSVLKNFPYYAINDTFYGYTSRGCVNKCKWCGVPSIEPEYTSYVDIKSMIKKMREEYGDFSKLKLMDNNVLASKHLKQIIDDLVELGYGKGEKTEKGKARVVDFNQGLDASHLTEKNMAVLEKINIKPMRVAFDRVTEEKEYIRALNTAKKKGVQEFSNYMLYNWKDTPKDLYDRLIKNINLNKEWKSENGNGAVVYSYPMRFAPINKIKNENVNRNRDYFKELADEKYDLLNDAVWTRKFVRNIEIMKGAAHGMISPTVHLAKRAIGYSYEEYVANLYMPEEMLRNRNKYEKNSRKGEPERGPGTGDIERFREFVLNNIKNKKVSDDFFEFHKVISQNYRGVTRDYFKKCTNKEHKKWLKFYLM